ncbi:MAG: hypothetical protein ACREV7_16670 [Steroidobacteraceae bacterium]
MPDPRAELTSQELVYAATALRAEARRAAQQAADPAFHASRVIFEDSALVYDALAGKLTRIAEQLTRAPRTRIIARSNPKRGAAMPTLPNVKRESLWDAGPGSLVSIAGHIFGLRAWAHVKGGEQRPAFVHLFRAGDRMRAQLIPEGPAEGQITGNTRVVNHTDAWSLYVKAGDWDLAKAQINFNAACQGMLLLEEVEKGSGLGLAVGVPAISGDCCRLRFDDWTLEDPRMIDWGAAKKWSIALPGAWGGLDWPLGGALEASNEPGGSGGGSR